MEATLLKMGADSLKKAALNEDAKNFILQNEKLFNVLKKAANRYIAGETIEEAIQEIKKINDQGFLVTTDFMGESIRNKQDANAATLEFLALSRAISHQKCNSSISLDLSHIGMLVSKDFALYNLERICEESSKANQEVILSMEGIDRTDIIIDIYKEVQKKFHNIGITVQAYLHRTKDDFKDLLELPGSIRLVKGAYDVPKHLALEKGSVLDEIYLNYAEQLLSRNHPCSIASHDEKIHRETATFIDKYRASNYVLERLLGIRNNELAMYRNEGYNCRIYVVYGKEWYLYLCNRFAEYPMNLFQALADIVE